MLDIRNCDNMDLMREFPDKCLFSVIDPPYGIGESGKNHKTRNTLVKQKDGKTMRRCPSNNYEKENWDNSIPEKQFFNELTRVSADILLFGANYYPEIVGTAFKPPRRNEFQEFINNNPKGWIVWDKVNGTSDFSDCELIHSTIDFDSYILPYMWAGMMQGVNITNGTTMQGNKSLNEKRIHPTQKPIILYKYLLKTYNIKKLPVLDTNLGSGSLVIACDELGLDFVGCDNNERIFNKATKRINAHVAQQKLFV